MKQVVKDTLGIATVVAITGAFIGLHSWMYIL